MTFASDMDRKFLIIVEGKEDYFFLKNYLIHIKKDSSSIELREAGGKSRLIKEYIKQLIGELEREHGQEIEIEIIVIADADENTREEVSKKLQGLEYKLFLFPDNSSNGNLEYLLEQIILPDKQDIFDCFKAYKRCLKERNKGYQLPDKKAKIYSYKEALGAKDEEKQFKPEYWNFDSSALDPLKRFLLENLG